MCRGASRWKSGSVHQGRSPGRADLPGASVALYGGALLHERFEGLVGHLDAHRGGHGGSGLQELVLELGGELPQAAGLTGRRTTWIPQRCH